MSQLEVVSDSEFYVFQTWKCKMLYTAYMYIISANYTWIFVEGLYLHMLIFMAFFSENKGIVRYLVLGWGE